MQNAITRGIKNEILRQNQWTGPMIANRLPPIPEGCQKVAGVEEREARRHPQYVRRGRQHPEG